ncbi:polyprenyl synthetase family protein [Peredibacter sp. HCB2-198]|uniref:polyprenyl synthetase family protein n=1 Tax=Peredibacter sp. HCB2-198 TaxID=3383025 RepID=UPI0038B5D2A6
MKLQELKQNLDDLQLAMTGRTSSDITVELNKLVEAGGKKFRPGLMFLMGTVFGLPTKKLTTYARSVELTHLASLIHDDVIDASDKRRNHPTLNSIKNNTTAILAGDYVLATIMGELARENNNELLIDLTVCIQDLADGEWLQYALKSKERVEFADLEQICIKKTGSLIRYCCTTPAKLAGHHDIPTMAFLGERIGLIFQMADDIVDGLNQSGRPAYQDIINGQFNYVTLKLKELYPELSDALYAFKKNPTGNLPWTDAQYQAAIHGVHNAINAEKDKIFTIFSKLCQDKNQEDFIPVFEMMINKIQSNYALAFENT